MLIILTFTTFSANSADSELINIFWENRIWHLMQIEKKKKKKKNQNVCWNFYPGC